MEQKDLLLRCESGRQQLRPARLGLPRRACGRHGAAGARAERGIGHDRRLREIDRGVLRARIEDDRGDHADQLAA